jgi:hypothetical protein
MSKTFNTKDSSFTFLRAIYDWTVYFELTLTKIQYYSDAYIFMFFKNESNKAVINYKTNYLEDNWHSFQLFGSNTQHNIQMCFFYQQ